MGFLARIISLAAIVALCAPVAPAIADTTIRVGGSTNITPPLTKMAAAYQAAHPGTTLSIAGSSSGQGIAALRAGMLDIACSDVAVDDPAFDDTTVGVIGIAFVVGGGAGIKNLTRDEVAGIYSGKITNWKQIGGNDLTIVPFSRPIGAGTRFVFETNVAKTLVDMKISADEHVYTLKSAAPEVKALVAYAATQQPILKAGGIVPLVAAAAAAQSLMFLTTSTDILHSGKTAQGASL